MQTKINKVCGHHKWKYPYQGQYVRVAASGHEQGQSHAAPAKAANLAMTSSI